MLELELLSSLGRNNRAEKWLFELDVYSVPALLLHQRNTQASVPADRLMITSVSCDQRGALFSCADTKLSCEPRCCNTTTHKLFDILLSRSIDLVSEWFNMGYRTQVWDSAAQV